MDDFLIIGGGIAGLSAGAQLSALGKVRVLEAEDALGYHASGRSAALYEPHYGSAAVRPLGLASESYLREANCGYLSARGLMLLGKAHEEAAFHAEAAAMNLDEITIAQALEQVPILNPDVVAFVALHSAAWDIDTDRLLQDFAKEIRAQGGTIETRARVETISRDGAHWQVQSTAGAYRARQIVNAAGAWGDVIAQLAGVAPVGLKPLRRSMARLPAPGGHDLSQWPMILNVGETWYAKPDAGMLIVSPAEEDLSEPHDAFADDMVLAEGLARYEEMMTTPVTRVQSNWAGLRSFVADRGLVLGPDPDVPGFIWCVGQGGYGFQTAPAAAKLLGDLIGGRPSDLSAEDIALITPERLR